MCKGSKHSYAASVKSISQTREKEVWLERSELSCRCLMWVSLEEGNARGVDELGTARLEALFDQFFS